MQRAPARRRAGAGVSRGHPAHEAIWALQRTAGNQAVAGLIQASRPPDVTASYEDCPHDWQVKAKADAARAKSWLPKIISGLANLPQPVPWPIRSYLSLY